MLQQRGEGQPLRRHTRTLIPLRRSIRNRNASGSHGAGVLGIGRAVDPDGPQVGVVNSRNQVELRKVTLGHDFGDTIEIMTGLRSGDAVVANPPDSLTNGMRVVVESAAPAQNAAQKGS